MSAVWVGDRGSETLPYNKNDICFNTATLCLWRDSGIVKDKIRVSLFVFGSLNAVQMPLNMFYSFWNPSHLIVKARPVSLLYFIYHLRQGGRGGWQGGENSKASVLGGLIFSVLSLGIMHGSWWKRCILVAGIYEWVQNGPQGGSRPAC